MAAANESTSGARTLFAHAAGAVPDAGWRRGEPRKHRPAARRRRHEKPPGPPRAASLVPRDSPLADRLSAARCRRARTHSAGQAPAPLAPGAGVVLAVGPEGGFTGAEAGALRQAGFAPVALGPYLLRFDTAAVAALTLAAHLRAREPA